MSDWDKRYRQGEHLNDQPHPLITGAAAGLAAGSALDVACGAGRHAIWLAERGWRVTAVDSSTTAIEVLQQRSREKSLRIDVVPADLERHEFVIEPDSFDLIVVCNYLQRDLFPSIRSGTRVGGIVIAIIAMVDADPITKEMSGANASPTGRSHEGMSGANASPAGRSHQKMNPAYLLNPGELRAEFDGWEWLHDFEGKRAGEHRRAAAEIVARRPS